MAKVQPKCDICGEVITHTPWQMPCLHIVCNECAKQVVVYCRFDDMTARSSELTQCSDLMIGLETTVEEETVAVPCRHQKIGLFPCCVHCGELLDSIITDLQDWECEHCRNTNNGERFICTFCCKSNQEQRIKVERRKKEHSRHALS